MDVTLHTATGDDTTERFDLVVGADGLRSTVRRLAFGPDTDYLRPFNHIIGATVLKDPCPASSPPTASCWPTQAVPPGSSPSVTTSQGCCSTTAPTTKTHSSSQYDQNHRIPKVQTPSLLQNITSM